MQYFLDTDTGKHLKTDDTWKRPLIFSCTTELRGGGEIASGFMQKVDAWKYAY